MKKRFANNHISKISLLLIPMLISMILLSACGTAKNEGGETSEVQVSGSQNTGDELSFPLKEAVTLTYWMPLNSEAAKSIKDFNEMELYKELEKRTGVHIEFKHPPLGQETEQFNIMIASGNLPDLIYSSWAGYAGGIEKANKDGVAIKLNDLIDKDSPNLSGILSQRADVKKELVTDNGSIYFYPCIYEGPYLTVWYGPQIRKDWLGKLSLGIPQTIDEWYNVLKAFKEKDPNGNGKADEIPFVTQKLEAYYIGYAFISAWNMPLEFYNDSGTVKYGAIQPEFKEYLSTMRKWYQEGLIDPDFAATDDKSFQSKITGNLAGSYYGSCSGNLGRFTKIVRESNPDFELAGAPNPSIKKNDDSNILGCRSNYIDGGLGTAITSSNKYPDLSAKWLDYLYGKEGNTLVNYGIEGITYNVVDGNQRYTDEILKNSKGLSRGEALSKYTHVTVGGPFVENEQYWKMLLEYPEQLTAIDTWAKASSRRLMPPVTPSADESRDLANITNEIKTYISEMTIKFIMGEEPVDKFDEFVKTIQGMKIDEAITIEQNALDRYMKRN